MLNIQILALTLIPLFSGMVPADGKASADPLALLGIEEQVSRDFLIGKWRYRDHFFRWGITDKKRAGIEPFSGRALMTLSRDGTVKMVNFFRPSDGRWELTAEGLVISDPNHPARATQLLPVRKRDHNRIWLMLPFSDGSLGIGMERVHEEASAASDKPRIPDKKPDRPMRGYRGTRFKMPQSALGRTPSQRESGSQRKSRTETRKRTPLKTSLIKGWGKPAPMFQNVEPMEMNAQ